MNDIINVKKRKISEIEDPIEINEEQKCMEKSTEWMDSENTELDLGSISTTQISDYNLEILSSQSQSSIELINEEPIFDAKQRLLELDDEVRQLKVENDELRSKLCSLRGNPDAAITVVFNNIQNFNLYKEKILNLIRLNLELFVKEDESNLEISFLRDNDINPDDWVIIDEHEVSKLEKPHKRKRKKRGKSNNVETKEPSLFVVDTTPSINLKNSLIYESKFTVGDISQKVDAENENKTAFSTCFNCNENHNLRDCFKRKDFNKINQARQKFKLLQQSKAMRYHLENDQRYAHLNPGKMSKKLQDALGLKHNQLPQYIYRMRTLGYPPGWFKELISSENSDLVLFDFDGKGTFNPKKTADEFYLNKIVEYPGFNVPTDKEVKDEYKLHNCPPFSKDFGKQVMLEFIHSTHKKAKDNMESCDMDIDNLTSDKEVDIINGSKEITDMKKVVDSPSLIELETEKEKLMAELAESNGNSFIENATTLMNTTDIKNTTIDYELNNSLEEKNSKENKLDTLPKLIKISSFGTPILKSGSPYSRLPKSENFSKNVSEMINFENLPNTTGKYEKMVGVLEKVRKTLKGLSDQKI